MKPVVLFDGECGLCNGAVALLLRVDRHGVFAITGGRGPAGRRLLERAKVDPELTLDTVAVLEGNQVWTQFDAVIRVLSLLPFPVSLLSVIRVVPRPLRNLRLPNRRQTPLEGRQRRRGLRSAAGQVARALE